MDDNRGIILNRRRGAQIRDMSGIRFGNITPTDIDALIEYHDKLFIFIETKFGKTELPTGQRLAIARLCDALQKSGKKSIAFITTHNYNPEQDINFAETDVVEYRYNFRWCKPAFTVKLRNAVLGFIHKNRDNP